jgi:hypothetical protein
LMFCPKASCPKVKMAIMINVRICGIKLPFIAHA